MGTRKVNDADFRRKNTDKSQILRAGQRRAYRIVRFVFRAVGQHENKDSVRRVYKRNVRVGPLGNPRHKPDHRFASAENPALDGNR